jgi:hypothetical protein
VLNVPAVLAAFLLILTPALSDPEGAVDGSAETETGPPDFFDTPDLRSREAFESVLMGILAVAAVAFQFHRKYAASQRGWQRIATTDQLAPPAAISRISETTDTVVDSADLVSTAPIELVSSATLAPVPRPSRRA